MYARGAWHFPAVCGASSVSVAGERDAAAAADVEWVVNFVLDRSHVLMVEGVPCVTLGHGRLEPVAAHPFWGTEAVVDALRGCDGWQEGHVVLGSPLRPPTRV